MAGINDEWPTEDDVRRMEVQHARRMGRLLETSYEAGEWWDEFHRRVPFEYPFHHGHEPEDIYAGRVAHHLALMCDTPHHPTTKEND